MNGENFFSRLSSRDGRYNSSKQGEASFRVLYYGGATGSVPFVWESQPGTPKHKFSDAGHLPPLTPPPQHMSSPQASPCLKKSHSRILASIFARAPSKKSSAPSSPASSSWSSSRSSSYSLPSTPFRPASRGRWRSKMELWVDGDEHEEGGADSPTSTLCFRGGSGSCSRRNKGYRFFYPVKKMVKSIAGGIRHY